MTTLSDTVEKVERRLLSGIRSQFVTLTGDHTSGAILLTLGGPSLNAVQPGARLAVDLEMFLVEAITANGIATVIPAYEGSSPAAHSAGTVCYINPRFSRFDIAAAVNDDLLDLSAPYNGLGQVKTIDITYNPVYMGYDLGSGFDSASSKVLEVSYKIAPPTRSFPLIRKGDYRVVRNQSDAAFPSGNGIVLYREGFPGLPVHVQYLAPFAPLANLSDDLHTVAGLPTAAVDLPAIGAQILLVQPREVKRTFIESQPDARKATEVPPNATQQSTNALEKQRQRRIDAEADRLMRAFPNAENF